VRKPVSKQALRRAIERVVSAEAVELRQPIGTVVDRVWHELQDQRYGPRKPRSVKQGVGLADMPVVDTLAEVELE
jgi:hypothetical protein